MFFILLAGLMLHFPRLYIVKYFTIEKKESQVIFITQPFIP